MSFNINTENILKSSKQHNHYVYSKTYDRIYRTVGNINHHNTQGDDNIPTILVDTNGHLSDFKSLKAENVYEVISLPNDFSYTEYSKNLT